MNYRLILLLIAVFALPADSDARRKRRRRAKAPDTACGISFLPLKADARWVYQNVPPDTADPSLGVQANPPEEITISVVSIDTAGDKTTITLEESYRKISRQTTLSCTASTLTVDPSSFLWAGEPGGGLQMTLNDFKRQGHSYPAGKDFAKGATSEEQFRATVERLAAPGSKASIKSGKVEIERTIEIFSAETLVTPFGEVEAVRIEIALSGRGHLDGEKTAEREMPAGAKSMLWFSPGVGLVKVINRFNNAWVLKPATDETPSE